jgi:hypothetical protein
VSTHTDYGSHTILARWTNDLFLSSVHWVTTLVGGSHILAMMFLMPQGNFPVECIFDMLPRHKSAMLFIGHVKRDRRRKHKQAKLLGLVIKGQAKQRLGSE